ncbi:hypothetical protein L596_028561 [Steinernema carpocapsae]|uniref:Alpha-carbonic anhydrase domain-containing protein n=1 Tax=Steinernema carpocapsae TaxID=34508 RepID=A0A4U5LYT2_STECR|nr:hypothetical protein L596_028561 [Steinernema carpocapsae]
MKLFIAAVIFQLVAATVAQIEPFHAQIVNNANSLRCGYQWPAIKEINIQSKSGKLLISVKTIGAGEMELVSSPP